MRSGRIAVLVSLLAACQMLAASPAGRFSTTADFAWGSFGVRNWSPRLASVAATQQAEPNAVPAGRHRAVQPPRLSAALPQATSDAYAATQGSTLSVAAPGVFANDSLSGAGLSAYGATGSEQTTPGHAASTTQSGTVILNADGSFVYDAAAGFAGVDTFAYALTNSAGTSTATVTITVAPLPPVAAADSYTTAAGAALTVPAPGVLGNDTLNGATIASYGVTGNEQTTLGAATATAQGGSVTMSATGGFTFTPAASFNGNDTFRYVLRNGGGSSTATVTVAVQPPAGPDFVVTSPGFFYSFDKVGGENPPLTLTRGRTYTFQIDVSSIHPFEILGAPAGSVTNNNISSGTLTFRVPTTAGNYRYECSIHSFGNTITTVP